MPDQFLVIFNLGGMGVKVDLSPLHLPDNAFPKAQNVIGDPLGSEAGLKNRPGLTPFNPLAAAGAILGGIGVPLTNLKTGTRFWFLGRGPTT